MEQDPSSLINFVHIYDPEPNAGRIVQGGGLQNVDGVASDGIHLNIKY